LIEVCAKNYESWLALGSRHNFFGPTCSTTNRSLLQYLTSIANHVPRCFRLVRRSSTIVHVSELFPQRPHVILQTEKGNKYFYFVKTNETNERTQSLKGETADSQFRCSIVIGLTFKIVLS